MAIMKISDPDKEPAKEMAITPQSVGLMEPMLVSSENRDRARLSDLAIELAEKSAAFRSGLPAGLRVSLAELVRSMNCYYSNLIEGHDTHPIDIERALNNDYSADPKQRDLQLEAKAHIEVQAWIDAGGLDGRATRLDGLLETHRRFCADLPESLLLAENPETGETRRVVPGGLREDHVRVGRHIPPGPEDLPRFLKRFEEAYRGLGKTDGILSAAAAHHRLLWIHPFLDGNGRVARLMSYAIFRERLQTDGLWSVARGLARYEQAYKQHLQACDGDRRGDLDGRGSLSEGALAQFTAFFLTTAIDQVDFMEGLVEPRKLRARILKWAGTAMATGEIPAKSDAILEALLFRGELARGDVPGVIAASERSARRVTAALMDRGVLKSLSTRAPLTLGFPADLASDWMPGLFPAAPS